MVVEVLELSGSGRGLKSRFKDNAGLEGIRI
jgi:hypothetical protein